MGYFFKPFLRVYLSYITQTTRARTCSKAWLIHTSMQHALKCRKFPRAHLLCYGPAGESALSFTFD